MLKVEGFRVRNGGKCDCSYCPFDIACVCGGGGIFNRLPSYQKWGRLPFLTKLMSFSIFDKFRSSSIFVKIMLSSTTLGQPLLSLYFHFSASYIQGHRPCLEYKCCLSHFCSHLINILEGPILHILCVIYFVLMFYPTDDWTQP